MFSHQWLAEKGCHFKDGSSACSGICHLQRVPWTAVEITAPHPPAHLCLTGTYDLPRLSLKVHRCQNWHTGFSTKWMPYHGMCWSILHTTQIYCQAIVKSFDSWKMPSNSRWMIFRGLWFSGTRVNACDDFFCLLHYHRLWAFLKGFHVSSLKYVSGILVISTMWTSVCIIYIC